MKQIALREGRVSLGAVNTFDRHLLREWLQVLGLVLAAACGLLLAQVMFDDFRDLRELGARGWVLVEYIVVTMPSFLNVVMPLALLVSLLYVLGKLHRGNEFAVMRAAGVGFGRLMAPIWIVGIACCALAYWLSSSVVPWSVERSRLLHEELQYQHEAKTLTPDRVGAIYSVAFDNQPDRRIWFFNRYSRFTNHGYGVSVSTLDPLHRETTRLVAAEAWFDPLRRGWVFQRGRLLDFDAERGVLSSSNPFNEKFFANFREDPQLMVLVDRRPIDLSLPQLESLVDYFEVQHSPKVVAYAVRYYSLLADALAPLIVISIAIPFAVAGVRVNPAVGVSKAIGFFFLYYVLANLASSLAVKGVLSAEAAAWMPNACLAILAGGLFVRLR